ncbi:hypothetical protein SELMODRAFT_102882 [Selaginella moellendorffii]|uniref:Peroxidase n=2 Tax=Selaginella moellendorffii TaxID=88036 RepID=D8RVX5_SELML|nr:hypothetical protein SELMODRAFT_102882 [Selaginella moellendorffii]
MASSIVSMISIFLLFAMSGHALASLSPTFYSSTCPNLTGIVRAAVQQVVASQPRMCASLVRLFFHDCHVNGCDASIMLNGSNNEQFAFPNINSLRGYNVIENIKALVEAKCPNTVSCADIIVIVARECVMALNGPTWTVTFGRRDSLTANQTAANVELPPFFFNVSRLIANFQSHGLSVQDLVALSGSHTIGQGQCGNFKSRLYGPSLSSSPDYMNPYYNQSLRSQCPSSGGDSNLSPLDLQTPVVFDNKYYKNLINFSGLFHSDQTLWSGGDWTVAQLVHTYAMDQARFFQDFATGMINMGNLKPLLAPNGQIRKYCGKVN